MRFIKYGFYILAILVLQTVIFPRLNFFGAVPDLVLVSVIAGALAGEALPSNIFAAVLALCQDLLSAGPYLNTIIKIIANNIAGRLHDGFVGDDYALAAGLVALFTPLQAIVEGLIVCFFFGRQFSPGYLAWRLVADTIYNLLLLPLIFPLVKALNDAE
jgi:rod shape-determining protein MreD